MTAAVEEDVTIAAGGGSCGAFCVTPAHPNGAGVVVLQEIFGVNPYVRDIARRLAAKGFAAVAPDLFWRQSPGLQLDPALDADRARAMDLFRGLDEALAVDDVMAAAACLRDRGSRRIGAVGYCMGGKLSYLAAMTQIDAAVSYYGVGIHTALDRAGELRAPVLLHIAEADALCPPEAQAKIHASLTAHPLVEICCYQDAQHAFARAGGAAFSPKAAAQAEAATHDFFARTLLRGLSEMCAAS
jgi:carboxymethylenebutenolidase